MPKKRGEMGGPAELVFGRILREHRLARGLTQEQLAERADCDRGYIGLLERGINSPSLTMLFQLAPALGIQPSELLATIESELASGSLPDPTRTVRDS